MSGQAGGGLRHGDRTGRLVEAGRADYPCYPKEVRLGNAAANDIYCYADKRSAPGREGFDVLANFSHSFFKPYNVTLDFTDMNVYIARGKAT
ncbi:hypothetical protein [Nonomuraea africana]|uniref:Uncharacterized protein n=1 Tax=Nonomuraea africana TaxID=46171 RepID=A0ABR9KF15_9ACTN|nr:hypothetical protein [Nonomuraea africana]MBE1560381.1 hypothetical protein [Nonomuraea africana]